jgi:hypothetical protein
MDVEQFLHCEKNTVDVLQNRGKLCEVRCDIWDILACSWHLIAVLD